MSQFLLFCMMKVCMTLVLFEVWHVFQFVRLIRNANTKKKIQILSKKNQTNKQTKKINKKNPTHPKKSN